ncbi:Predicted Zn-dependent peptidase [Paenibacillus sp. UNCCL117]|uniref:EF-P 5-aminopentanol modification-associated protein YfmH n=1 Tax=unclassified Paenibacillus TaxID=185978 RepID=UPI00088A84D5|nr:MULTISPECIES: pitrilysin family protein [unclassified Paenibacillus]SDC88318.1 Predicted Zn-dependent peptidase [Paenibacillus sp. cl123]SFW28275.1 Predicted Zn-dependent peptidase [Paenibacillus sp. UNCCL117]
MQTIPYPQVKETLYTETLPNGLSVFILPKPGFQKTYATFSTKYGSIDNHFRVEGQPEQKVPDGIAHFLEHKMFEEPTGDIFSVFAAQGASANAFTSFDRTAYLFSATGQIRENLTTLINFVQNPYFTDENVEKEKGIIGQEINMYADNPDWRSYFGLIETMYHVHPVHIDIAGTVASIAQISKEMLYECYHTFYHPTNMSLFVVGGVDPEEIMELIRSNQAAKTFKPQGEILRLFDQEPGTVKQARKTTKLPVSVPKCLFGCKEPEQPLRGRDMLKRELTMKVLLDALLSSSSAIYQKLYDEQLISDNFGSEYNIAEQYAFSVLGGDTKDPELLISRVQEEIDRVKQTGVSQTDFERSRKKKIGGFLRQLNSPEAIANEFTKYRFKDADLFDVLPVYEELTLEEVNSLLRAHFDWSQLAASIVRSEDQ